VVGMGEKREDGAETGEEREGVDLVGSVGASQRGLKMEAGAWRPPRGGLSFEDCFSLAVRATMR